MADWEKNDGEVSIWNEAMFKMKRLHELQSEINRVKMNLLAKHYLTGQWNYEVWFNSIVSLYSEGQAKYKEEEKKECDALKNIIEELLTALPVHKRKVNIDYSGRNKHGNAFMESNWKNIKKMIEMFESKVKLYNDKHGLSTANKENMDGRSILR